MGTTATGATAEQGNILLLNLGLIFGIEGYEVLKARQAREKQNAYMKVL